MGSLVPWRRLYFQPRPRLPRTSFLFSHIPLFLAERSLVNPHVTSRLVVTRMSCTLPVERQLCLRGLKALLRRRRRGRDESAAFLKSSTATSVLSPWKYKPRISHLEASHSEENEAHRHVITRLLSVVFQPSKRPLGRQPTARQGHDGLGRVHAYSHCSGSLLGLYHLQSNVKPPNEWIADRC